MAGLTVETLQRVMAAEGPVVSVVHVPAETGKPRGLVVDMTPRLRETTRLLGGPATFVGQVRHGAQRSAQAKRAAMRATWVKQAREQLPDITVRFILAQVGGVCRVDWVGEWVGGWWMRAR